MIKVGINDLFYLVVCRCATENFIIDELLDDGIVTTNLTVVFSVSQLYRFHQAIDSIK